MSRRSRRVLRRRARGGRAELADARAKRSSRGYCLKRERLLCAAVMKVCRADASPMADLSQDDGAPSGGTQTFGAATLDLKWGQRNLRAAQL